MVVLSGCFLLSACGQEDNKAALSPLKGWNYNIGDSFADATFDSTFSATGTEKIYHPETDTTTEETISVDSLAKAIAKGMISYGLDTRTAGTRTMTVVWLGKSFTVEYTVKGGGIIPKPDVDDKGEGED